MPVNVSEPAEVESSVSREPIFVVGVERSGTTLLSFMLSAHSMLAIPYESHFITSFARRRAGLENFATDDARKRLFEDILSWKHVSRWHPKVELSDLDIRKANDLPSAINELFSAFSRKSGKIRWGDKTPRYLDDLDVLNTLFPDCRFIHIIRDGRDVAMSLLAMEWGPPDFLSALRKWTNSVSQARKMLNMLPRDRWCEIRYEDLVLDPESSIRKVCDFVGLKFEPEMIDGYRADWQLRTAAAVPGIHTNLSKPPDPGQLCKWSRAMTATDQAIAHEIAGELLAALGYPPGRTGHPLKIVRKMRHRLVESLRFRLGLERRTTRRTNG